ncbi:uncharacterized protein LOC143079627 [Mytilus galloprovincialis]|uniref:uncharacterized protein LOC143079627 n=1 Tax=Mytilus galloprovincialis TaxID=29158 RepID=UPI003F7C358E
MLCTILIHVSTVLTVTAQKNLTPFGKATLSSSAYNTKPENAINPPISNTWSEKYCTHTGNGQITAWWMFNFSFGSAFITDVSIHYRNTYPHRMDGFKLYISNASTIPPPDYDLCYKDPQGLPYPEVTQTISCYQLGQYVIYYDDIVASGDHASFIELCYVAINGCEKTFWGRNCTKSCAERCIDRHCYPGNGSCVLGCNTKNCLKDLCDKSTAVCTNGCRGTRTGTYCNKYNIATDASVSQIQIDHKPTNLANDGDKRSCFKSKGTDIRLQVDMREKRIVTEIHVTGKVNTTTKGLVHTIYASNSSVDPEKGTVLYHEESLPQHISTNAIFRYLTFVPDNKSAEMELEICEIGIVGCPSTQYGPLCNRACPLNCHGPCDLETGHCKLGCSNGWTGEKCEQVRSELQNELNGTAIGGGIGAFIAIILIMIAGCFIYKRNLKSKTEKYSYKSKSISKTASTKLCMNELKSI